MSQLIRTPWKYSLNVVYQGRSSILWALSGRLTCKSYCRNWVIRSLISVVMFSIEFVYKINEGCRGKRLIHQHCWYWFCHYTPCMLLDVWTSYSFSLDKMFYVWLLIWEECQLWKNPFLSGCSWRWIGWVSWWMTWVIFNKWMWNHLWIDLSFVYLCLHAWRCIII